MSDTVNSNGNIFFDLDNTGTASFSDGYGPRKLASVEHHPDKNQMHIIYRRQSNFTYTVSTVTIDDQGNYIQPSQPQDKLEKEIWGVAEGGKLELFRTIEGEVIPPSYTAERFKFNDPEGIGNIDQGSSDS